MKKKKLPTKIPAGNLKYALLHSLHLSEKQRSVLNAIERFQMAKTVSAIGRTAGVPRTSTIHILKKLERWRFAKQIRKNGKRTHWLYNRQMDRWS